MKGEGLRPYAGFYGSRNDVRVEVLAAEVKNLRRQLERVQAREEQQQKLIAKANHEILLLLDILKDARCTIPGEVLETVSLLEGELVRCLYLPGQGLRL